MTTIDSIIKLSKLATIDNDLILGILGALSQREINQVNVGLK